MCASTRMQETMRWQRRWFVLYDDGELTYSVDEHPETIPQAIIDMTKVLEVTTADNITSHPHSIAITAPDRVTFVKGTCPEESKWWFNVLVAFPKSKGRHKRNATFPGGQATTILQAQNHAEDDAKANDHWIKQNEEGWDGRCANWSLSCQPTSLVNPMAKRFAAIVAREINSQMYR
uniref:PH domain-containing protein n=1 Tax=Anopheles coluzzii TaxID=1518534 RepID=A0A8W7P8J3_ANOCL